MRQIVLFDGLCNLCNGWIRFIIRWDKRERFFFASSQSALGQRTSSGESMVYLRGEKKFIKSDAALYILWDLGGAWRISGVLLLIPRFLRDIVYNLTAKNRYKWFGKRDSCMVPEPALAKRFLS